MKKTYWIAIAVIGLAIGLNGCDSKDSQKSVAKVNSAPKVKQVALPDPQKQFCGPLRDTLSELDAAQTASDKKKEQAAILRILNQYKELTPETRRVSQWIGQSMANTQDKAGKPIAKGLLLSDPDPTTNSRIIFTLSGINDTNSNPGELARFSGNIAHLTVEYLTPVQGRFYEASVSTRGQIDIDATGLNLRGFSKARVIVELSDAQRASYIVAP